MRQAYLGCRSHPYVTCGFVYPPLCHRQSVYLWKIPFPFRGVVAAKANRNTLCSHGAGRHFCAVAHADEFFHWAAFGTLSHPQQLGILISYGKSQ